MKTSVPAKKARKKRTPTRQAGQRKPNRKAKLEIIELAKAGKPPAEIRAAYPQVRGSSISALVATHGPNNGRKKRGRPRMPQSISDLRDVLLNKMEAEIREGIDGIVRTVSTKYRQLLT